MKKILSLLLVLLSLCGCFCFTVHAGEYSNFGKVVSINTTADNIVIDGKIDSGEWGDPLIVETPQSLREKENMGWGYVPSKNPPKDQRVEIYLSNEGGVLYVACKMIGFDYEDGSHPASQLHQHAHFGFSMATYNEKTVVHRQEYQGKMYEYFGHFAVGIADGEKMCKSKTQGSDIKPLPDSDYAISYNAATRTYTYEVRVKEGLSKADLLKHNKVVMSFDVSGPRIDDSRDIYKISEAAYRILAGKGGAWQFSHAKTKPVLVNILETKDLVTNEFAPTEDESAKAVDYQSGFTPVDELKVLLEQDGWLKIAVPVAGVAAILISVFTVVFILVKRKQL